jgi:hypothetical protein
MISLFWDAAVFAAINNGALGRCLDCATPFARVRHLTAVTLHQHVSLIAGEALRRGAIAGKLPDLLAQPCAFILRLAGATLRIGAAPSFFIELAHQPNQSQVDFCQTHLPQCAVARGLSPSVADDAGSCLPASASVVIEQPALPRPAISTAQRGRPDLTAQSGGATVKVISAQRGSFRLRSPRIALPLSDWQGNVLE